MVSCGPVALAAAYYLREQGHAVRLYEADKVLVGMSASFGFDGIRIERYQHFICKSDQPLFDLLPELDSDSTLCWTETRLGYYCGVALCNWGDMPALLKFPCPGLVSKIRYGLVAFTSTKRRDRRKLNSEGAASCYVQCYWRLIMFVDRCLPAAYWRVPRYSVVLGLRG